MKKYLLIVIACTVLVFVTGCGTTNCLSWTKSSGSNTVDKLDLARSYIDNAEYSKAESVLNDYLSNHSSSKEANILYGQAQLGLADVDLASIISALSEESPTPSLAKLNTICSPNDRSKVYDAADRFIIYPPTDTSDLVIAAFCGLIAYTGKIHDAYDPANDGLQYTGAGDPASVDNPTSTWNTEIKIKGNDYLKMANNNLAKLSGDKELQDSISSANIVFDAIDLVIGTTSIDTWAELRTALLSF